MTDGSDETLEEMIEYKGDKEFVSSTDALYGMASLDEALFEELLKKDKKLHRTRRIFLSIKAGVAIGMGIAFAYSINLLTQYDPKQLWELNNPILLFALGSGLITLVESIVIGFDIRSILREKKDQYKKECNPEKIGVFYSIDPKAPNGYTLTRRPYDQYETWEYLVTPVDDIEALEHLHLEDYVFINGVYAKDTAIVKNSVQKKDKRKVVDLKTREPISECIDYTVKIRAALGEEEFSAEIKVPDVSDVRAATEAFRREPHYIIGTVTKKGSINILHYGPAVLKPGVDPLKPETLM